MRILTTDLIIIDKIARLEENPQLQKLIDTYDLKSDGKMEIDWNAMTEFRDAFANCANIKLRPGGSASNTIRTMAKILGHKMEGRFIGVMGQDGYTDQIKTAFKESGIVLDTDIPMPDDYDPKNEETYARSAVSFVIVYPDGKRTIATYAGTAKNIMTAKAFPDDLIRYADAVFLQGSIIKKFNKDVITNILQKRWDYNKQAIFAAPTSAFQPDYCEYLLPSMNIFLSNTEELDFIFGQGNVDANLGKLWEKQKATRHILEDRGFKPQVAMITHDKNGGYVVSADGGIIHAPAHDLGGRQKVNGLGAGDTSYAFFLAGLTLDLGHKQCLELAMAGAGAKVLRDGPTLDNPLMVLAEVAPNMARLIRERLRNIPVTSREVA